MATLTWPRNCREGLRKTRLSKALPGMTPVSPNTCLKEAIAASLGTSIEAPVTPEDICPDHLHPRRTGAVKEYDKQLKQLNTENFKLKLEIFFLLQDKKEDEPTNKLQELIQLQVKAEELRKELNYKNSLLRETLKTLEQQEPNGAQDVSAKEKNLMTECDAMEKQLSSIETNSSFLNNNSERGDQPGGNSVQDMEEAMNVLLAIATASTTEGQAQAPTDHNSLQSIFQKLQEPISKKCMQFLRALYHLKEDLEEKDEKIRLLLASIQRPSLPSDLTSSDNSMDQSYAKDYDLKMMEKELNSLHNAIREKEVFIKELLEERASILEGSKVSTENYLSIISKMEEEKEELQRVVVENRQHMDKMEADMRWVQQKVQEHQEGLTEQGQVALVASSQLDKLNKEMEEMQRTLREAENAVLTKEAEIGELREVLSRKDAELEVVKKNLKDTQNELVRLKAVTEEREKEAEDAMHAMKRNYAELEAAFANLERVFSEGEALKDAVKSPRWDGNLKEDLASRERDLFEACTQLRHLSELLEAEKRDKLELVRRLSGAAREGDSCTEEVEKGKADDSALRRRMECKDAELHELRRKYRESVESVVSLEKALDAQSCGKERGNSRETLDAEKSQSRIQNRTASVDPLGAESNPESSVSVNSSPLLYHLKSRAHDFSKFGQTNDVLQLKEENFLMMLHLQQLESELKEKTQDLTSRLANSQAVCRMLHDHLEELSDFMEKLLRSEDLSLLIRSSLTPDGLSRLESLLYHDLDQTLNRSRSVWMVDGDNSMNSMLATLDQLDMEPSKDRDLSIITVTSHVRQDGAIADSSDALDKTSACFSVRRSCKGGKPRTDKLDEMIKKGERMCLEMRRLNVHNDELMACLLKKLEGNDSDLTHQIDNHLKIVRKKIENMISHCAKLFETFKAERSWNKLTEEKLEDSQNKYASLQDSQRRPSARDFSLNNHEDLEACHYDISICLQELLDVQQKIGGSIHSNDSDDRSEPKTKSKIGARLLHTARRTVEGLLHQVIEKESAWREREVELSQYHRELGACLQELRHIQQKVVNNNQNQSTDSTDEGTAPNNLPAVLQQTIRKTTKSLLQKVMEKEGELKLSRERNVELERNLESKKREIQKMQDWSRSLQKEGRWESETSSELMAREGAVESEHSISQRQAKELETLREALEKRQCQENSDVCFSRKQICVLEEEITSLKANSNKELDLQRETARQQLRALGDEIDSLKAANEAFRLQSETASCAAEKAKESNVQLRNELQQTKQHYDDLKHQVSMLKSEMESVWQTDANLQEKNETICALELVVTQLKLQLGTSTQEQVDLLRKVCQSDIALREKDDVVKSLEASASNLKQQLEGLVKAKMELEEEQHRTISVLQEKKGLIDSLQESLSGVKHQMEDVVEEKRRLHDTVLRNGSVLQNKDCLIQSLQEQIYKLKQELQDATNEQEKLREKGCQSDEDARQKERLCHALQVQINKLQQELNNSMKQQKMLLDKTCQTDADGVEKDRLISALESVVAALKDRLEASARECDALRAECRQQQNLLESKVSKEDGEADSLHLSTFLLQQELNAYVQKFKQLEEWNLAIQQQVQEKERSLDIEKDALRKENLSLKKKFKKMAVKKGTEVEHSSSEVDRTILRLQKELKEAAQLNASLHLELKVYQHLGHKPSQEGSPHQKDMLLELVEEMRQLRGELTRSVRANSQLRHQLENYIEQDIRGKMPDLAFNSSGATSSDNIHQLSPMACSPSSPEVVLPNPLTSSFLPSRLSSDSSLHARVRQLLGGVAVVHRDTSQPDGSSSNEDLRSIYSSPDLGIESDPNRGDSSSTTSGHALNKLTPAHRIGIPVSTDKNPDSCGGVKENSLRVVGPLEAFELLQKQVAESLVVLRGVKARLQDRLQTVSSSPSKNMEYNTLKELDRSCYYLQVFLEKGKTLLSSFKFCPQISPLLEENSKLREEIISLQTHVKEQSSQLHTALEKLTITQNKKDGMERAITKKLTKTRKVLKQAKCNLLEENRKPPQPTLDLP